MCIVTLFFSVHIFAQNVGTLLDDAKKAHESGDLEKTLKSLTQAKEQIEKEILSKNSGSYIDVPNWDAVKISPEKFIGKKVKVIGAFHGVSSDKTIYIGGISGSHTFSDKLIDKILSLQKYKEYTWYGEVFDAGLFGPQIKIENIE